MNTSLTRHLGQIGCLCLALTACAPGNTDTAAADAKMLVVPVTELIPRDTLIYREYVADVRAVRHVEIHARVRGYLEEIYVDEGKVVRKGQRMFRINSEEYKLELAKADAQLKTAIAEAKGYEVEQQRVRMLVEKDVVAATELELAHVRLEASRSRIDEARSARQDAAIKLARTEIRAPFEGVIDRIPLKVGSVIEEGELLTTVSDVHEIFTYFYVSENEYLDYVDALREHPRKELQAVDLVLADGTIFPHVGHIETVDGEFDANTGSIAFRARFPNPERLLKHGASGKVKLASKVKNSLIVPQQAVLELQDKNYVYVLDNEGRVSMRSFVASHRFSHFYIAASGLQPGEKIVYEGIQNLRDGMQVESVPARLDSLINNLPLTMQ